MKNLNLKFAAISSLVVYAMGIVAFVGSYFVPVMGDPDLQANTVLMIMIVPAAILGARLYYKRGFTTHGLMVAIAMFIGAIILDATITVPLFIIPNGGNHMSFFGDPGFWWIGIEYICVVTAYWLVSRSGWVKNISKSSLK